LAIEILEVISRSEQGITKPYICRASDNLVYYVKSSELSNRERCAELISNRLAHLFGLPVAKAIVVDIPSSLLGDISNNLDYSGLKAGPAFASERQIASDIYYSNVASVPFDQRCDIFIFYRWIRNSDRTLSKLGGNPNMLWEPKENNLILIDHNLAFDVNFDHKEFYTSHVFANEPMGLITCEHEIESSQERRQYYEGLFEKTLSSWNDIVAELPDEWLTANATVNTDDFRDLLEEYRLNSFWKTSE